MLYGWHPWRPLLLGFVHLFLLSVVLSQHRQSADLSLGNLTEADSTAYHSTHTRTLDVFLPGVSILESRRNWKIDTRPTAAITFAWMSDGASYGLLKIVGWFVVTLGSSAALTGIVKRE